MASDPKYMNSRAYEPEDASVIRHAMCYLTVSTLGHRVLPQSDSLDLVVHANQLAVLTLKTNKQICHRPHPRRTCQAPIINHCCARVPVGGN